MLLISNDCQIIKSFKQTRSMADTDLTTQYWGGNNILDYPHFLSLIKK
jgi:hypothetical protein